MFWIAIILLSAVSGILYRAGGMGDEGRKSFPTVPGWFFNTKARDIGCPMCCFLSMLLLHGGGSFPVLYWVVSFLGFGLLFGALTTYWDFLFGYDNHWMHGFMCGLAYFPYAIVEGHWIGFGVRCMALAMSMGLISSLSGNDTVEEVGRGAVLPLTLPLMLL